MLTKPTILGPQHFRTMPWKNGGGSTQELIAMSSTDQHPDLPFAIRLSIATIEQSGPFSLFTGYDRIIIQLSGPPVTLSHAGRPGHTLALLSPYDFSGDWQTRSDISGTATDFNVMVRRDLYEASVSIQRQDFVLPSHTIQHFLYVHSGQIEIPCGTECLAAASSHLVSLPRGSTGAIYCQPSTICLHIEVQEK